MGWSTYLCISFDKLFFKLQTLVKPPNATDMNLFSMSNLHFNAESVRRWEGPLGLLHIGTSQEAE